MLPNVWSVDEFKKQSSKLFSRGRSIELQKIDQALARAHSMGGGPQGTKSLIELIEAIAAWRKAKAAQGKTSGRAAAVDQLHGQLQAAAETIYKRQVTEQRAMDVHVGVARAVAANAMQQAGVVQGSGNVAKLRTAIGAQRPPVPGPPVPPRPPQPPLMPQRDADQDRLFDYLAQAMIDQRRKAMAFDDEDLFEDLDARQKGRLTARWMLCVPDAVNDVPAARAEALRVIAAMLGNDDAIIKNLLQNNLEVVVVPRDQAMPMLEQFSSLRGVQIAGQQVARGWDATRGAGYVKKNNVQTTAELFKARGSRSGPGAIVAIDPKKGKLYTAICEENLLGGPVNVVGASCYAVGYSTATHEFAHAIHTYGLNKEDQATIERAYKLRLSQSVHEIWVDGPREANGKTCYAATTLLEYFAQLSNAWLGANTGNDPYTQKPRNNGRQWVLDHEPKFVSDVLERVWGKRAIEGLNPTVMIKS